MLNLNELSVLRAAVTNVMETTRGDFGYANDVRMVGFSKNQIKGYLGQLVQKGLIHITHENGGKILIKDAAKNFVDVEGITLH